ncbi:MAG: DUF721 domain-containing protein [Verrucomicrobiales bacterium]|nr:DUF721 domain-containing protein [Verrucomicrobiales bacterium]
MLTAWRGVEPGLLGDMPTRTVSDMVGKVVAQSGINERLKLEEVQNAWQEVVGDFLYGQSKPDTIQRGVLVVRVLQPAVHHALMQERPRILKRLREKLGQNFLKEVRFKHG